MTLPRWGTKQGRIKGRFGSYHSTCIGNLNYDPLTQNLSITFSNPAIGTWKFFDVPVFEYAGLETASSKGEYFNQNIRDHYSYVRIS